MKTIINLGEEGILSLEYINVQFSTKKRGNGQTNVTYATYTEERVANKNFFLRKS